MNEHIRTARLTLLTTVTIACASTSTMAAPSDPQIFHLPAQDLGSMLRAIGHASGIDIMFASETVAGRQALPLDGIYTAASAVDRALGGSGLVATDDKGTILIHGEPVSSPTSAQSKPDADIVVTGTRIRGQAIASPILTRTQTQLQDEGFTSLADVVRALPQSFNGGQNPGVAVGAGGSTDNENLASGSTINLRGIGQDATLTLINGHRVAYNIASQGIDVSIVPLAALDRLEIVTDGASAVYGSDAVAGVANIILKPDYDGLTTSARLGAATDGGDFQQQYDVVGGTRWSTGGAMLTYDFERDTPVKAGQRTIGDQLYPDDSLFPYLRRHAAILTAHQMLSPDLTFSIEGLFNKRWSNQHFSATSTANYLAYGIGDTSKDTSFSIAPTLKWRIGRKWEATASGVYAQDHAHYSATLFLDGAPLSPNAGCYCNSFKSAEMDAEGPIFQLPAGDVRLALGGGYRSNGFHGYRTVGTPFDVKVSQGTAFVYGEASVPLIAPALDVPLIRRLDLDAAVRYESYPHVAQVTTPKIGLVWAPSRWVDVKASWGRSFKAPTLYQLHAAQQSLIYTATDLGASGYPSDATAIELAGGNPDLKPERAETWTATLAFHPLPRFEAELSYYHIAYHNRVITPIPTQSSTLSDPDYASLVTLAPSLAEILSAVDTDRYLVDNYSNGAFSPGTVVAIVDDRYQNIARQTIHGVDASVHYVLQTRAAGTLTFDGAATYLDSRQTLAPGQADAAIAGTIFNPPHVRARGGISWNRAALTLSGYASFIGPVDDDRFQPRARIGAVTSLDLTARYQGGAGRLRGVDILLSLQNALNAKPARIRTTINYEPPYDSTNYSAIGRLVSLTVAKKW